MADIDWPVGLPQKMNQESYSRALGSNVLRSPMEVGPAKARKRSSCVIEPMAGQIFIEKVQLPILKTFWKTTLKDGALRFNWVSQDDLVIPIEVRFTKPPSWAPAGKGYLVDLELEILP
jgi:hypothetical protein